MKHILMPLLKARHWALGYALFDLSDLCTLGNWPLKHLSLWLLPDPVSIVIMMS